MLNTLINILFFAKKNNFHKVLDKKRQFLKVELIKLAGPIAQLVELPAHNRAVRGSNPLGPTIL